jgi:hypothetical protein
LGDVFPFLFVCFFSLFLFVFLFFISLILNLTSKI